MRLSPVVLFALRDADLCDRLARNQSRTTHGAPQAVDACAAFAGILRHAILRQADPVAGALAELDVTALHSAVAAVLAGSYKSKDRTAISSSGYVVHTLEAALWSVHRTKSFEDALILAVNLANDADTVGAVTGQLAGAIYGASAIPDRWLQTLAWRKQIEHMTAELMQQAASKG